MIYFKSTKKRLQKSLTDSKYTNFEEIFLRTLDYHVQIKKKLLRANKNSFMRKALCKAITLRSRIENLYLKKKLT